MPLIICPVYVFPCKDLYNKILLTLSDMQTKSDTFANSVDSRATLFAIILLIHYENTPIQIY